MEFTFLLPRKIVFGRGSAATAGEEAKELGSSRTLVVTSPGMLRRDGYSLAVQSLKRSGVGLEIFSDIVPEPTIENVDDCAAAARRDRRDLVIGLGGGSVIDVAKKTAADLKLPMMMMPTTAGTGSEVTHESVLKVDGKKKAFVDEALVPEVAIVDPDLAETMPPWLAVSSGIDALAHALECWQSRKRNPLVETLAKDAFVMLKENISRSIEGDKQARSN
ncbi:MAG: iron-containing alcohol dehydrogenase, partial [Dehalococcoidia bacterium]